ncbi:MAG TPA: gliding motility-associated C-terminal domain-containing protein [Puia sp.]|uniref:T9SS type B sorting domain-containing protein n=1 Tax=Puia sp. TaxID=2045100 RepID=UPI002B6B1402|nr:gliding motility-associated C-terminal domain-containing protein [Puia sp.]HVU96498.1 gliding motility-associated C-terminal domain-containing protein [Puia sp.]
MKLLFSTLSVWFSLFTSAQVCTSGLGDPIVKFTFGSGTATYGPALPSSVTKMTYEQSSCPQGSDIGGYSIIHSPDQNCFGGDWVNFTGDHTGDPNGYFMCLNASTPPSDFYRQQVDGLCSGTSYQFSAWIVNMASHAGEIMPDITFSIQNTDGSVIQSFDTGPVPIVNPAKWNQYAFYFATPPGITSVVISMRNNAPGGYGNDLGLDDITFRTSGPSIAIAFAGHAGDSVMFCADAANSQGLVGAVGSCYPSSEYQWQLSTDHGANWADIPGAVNPVYSATPTTAGSYLYRLASAQAGNIGNTACKVVSSADSIIVLSSGTPGVSIVEENPACVDSTVVFTAQPVYGGPAPSYLWTVNGITVGGNTAGFSAGTFSDGDQVSCLMTSSNQCPRPTADAFSNVITIKTIPDVISSVSIVSTADAICRDSLVIFTATPTNGGDEPVYQWLINGNPMGPGGPVYQTRRLDSGDVVSVRMTGSLRCSGPAVSNVVAMTVYDQPVIHLTPDTIIAAHSQIVLDPTITGRVDQYHWEPAPYLSDTSQLHPIVAPIGTTVYEIVANNSFCSATASEKVEVFYDLLMPNAFSPNGDGRDDVFRIPPSVPLTIRNFAIYNRWGALIFATANAREGWDGTFKGQAQAAGTYVWVIEYENPILKKNMMRKGVVELVR